MLSPRPDRRSPLPLRFDDVGLGALDEREDIGALGVTGLASRGIREGPVDPLRGRSHGGHDASGSGDASLTVLVVVGITAETSAQSFSMGTTLPPAARSR
jgi:hypothetical protein